MTIESSEVTNSPEVQTTDTPPQNLNQALTLNDLILMGNIIQVTTQRGAFKAEEMATIGGLYDKLVKFLESAGAVTRADATPESINEEVAAEESTKEEVAAEESVAESAPADTEN
jgi:hypothetical protein